MLPSAPSKDHTRRALLRNCGRDDKFKASNVAEAYEPATYERRAPAVVQVAADLARCSSFPWEHPGVPPGDEAQVLPLKIAVDRVFDVVWYPPGHPQLCAREFSPPLGIWTPRAIVLDITPSLSIIRTES